MRKSRLSAASVAAIATTVAITTGLAGPSQADNPNNSKKFTEAVKPANIETHLKAFQSIADQHDGNRGAGTSGYDASGAYVEKVLHKAGYETERQYFDFVYDEVVSTSLDEVSPDQRAIEHAPMSYSHSTPVGGVEAELEAPSGAATGCDMADWSGFTTGKIALISRGACSFAIKAEMAKDAGASAAIIYNNADGALNGTLGDPDGDYAPVAGVPQAEGQALLTKMASGPVTVAFDLVKVVENRRTFNVIAETEKGRDDNVVMLGSHLDGVHDGPGLNDNGSGSATILEVAVQLAKVKKLNNKVRFAWWGAEELGLLGSNHYVNDKVTNDPASLDDIATYLNFDMLGSPNYMIGVYDADQSTYEAPVEVPAGSPETEDVFTSYFDSIGQPWVDTAYSGRSDYQAFITNGVPAGGLFTGADGVKTEEEVDMFGGTAGITYDPQYHSPGDDLDNVNMDAVDIMSNAIAHTTITLAYDTSSINGESGKGKSGKPRLVKPQVEGALR